jgi:hypothetical protein
LPACKVCFAVQERDSGVFVNILFHAAQK